MKFMRVLPLFLLLPCGIVLSDVHNPVFSDNEYNKVISEILEYAEHENLSNKIKKIAYVPLGDLFKNTNDLGRLIENSKTRKKHLDYLHNEYTNKLENYHYRLPYLLHMHIINLNRDKERIHEINKFLNEVDDRVEISSDKKY